ncbi:Bax protein [Pseudoalteromonas espejiana DSM 9414]|uniref:Glycoside hydrolase family 73 n=1 Tax=Pseudoalteromonas espejiana TaxID=28107 RepID=A0A510XTK2_9GAMM|nr:glucosaminidase domain-containing protein [Pseudoalteromonas espejiana]ASM50274.1 Bax protein [Pseudoalteromonas espejiana DSM 9414]GEK53917.1 glycoside hydrolase family 73 [Pseudoalteromonas espejiana]
MLKTIFQFLLTVFFVWALAYPFMQSDELEVDEQATSEQPKKVQKKEKPLHNVKIPKFSEFADVKQKKQAFFDFFRPHVEAENKKILQQRAKLEIARMMLEYNEPLEAKQQRDIVKILKLYGLPETVNGLMLSQALRRVDIIPKELALMQAANESAWGTSRFARIGLNFFGQWCYSKGCGMVPRRRNSGAAHEVAAFKSVRAAVSSYFRNINTHNAYKELRAIREDLRRQQKPIAATALTHGLMSYSERGEAYIEELNTMINQNRAYFDE